VLRQGLGAPKDDAVPVRLLALLPRLFVAPAAGCGDGEGGDGRTLSRVPRLGICAEPTKQDNVIEDARRQIWFWFFICSTHVEHMLSMCCVGFSYFC
jgi:hypothetical protein